MPALLPPPAVGFGFLGFGLGAAGDCDFGVLFDLEAVLGGEYGRHHEFA